MSERLKPWRLRIGGHSRAFVAEPRSRLVRMALWLRGWRHTHYYFWTKPSPNQAALESGKPHNV